MIRRFCEPERGQAAVEFALIAIVLMMLTVGLVDVGRAFFQYNAMAAAARYGARWGAVVGGTCALPYAHSSNDWCNQLSTGAGKFWSQSGNAPLQGTGTPCPSYGSTPSAYYTASSFVSNTGTTVVGAVAQKFDSNSSSTNFVAGKVTPGLDLSQLKVCVELTTTATTPKPGDVVGVQLYYSFHGLSSLFIGRSFDLNATSQYQVE